MKWLVNWPVGGASHYKMGQFGLVKLNASEVPPLNLLKGKQLSSNVWNPNAIWFVLLF